MEADSGSAAAAADEEQFRWPHSERRSVRERRRSARGWFELRARREGVQVDRRQPARRTGWWARTVALLTWRRQGKGS